MRLKTLIKLAEEDEVAVVRKVTDHHTRITVADDEGHVDSATFVTDHRGRFKHAEFCGQKMSLKSAAKFLGFTS